MKRVALVALTGILLFGAKPAIALEERNEPPSIIVHGEGKAFVKPTLATLEIGVVTEASSAAKALAANSAAMTELMSSLTGQGITERDVQTSNFDVSPKYSNGVNGRVPRIDGYTVSNNVHVRIHKTSQVGPVIDAVVQSGANQVNRIAFSVEDSSKMMDEARRDAMADAKRKAAIYAQAAGVTLGKVLYVIEGGGAIPGPVPMYRMQAAMQSTPISSGEQQLNVNTTVVFAIQ